MRYARRAANSDLIKDVLNLVAASLGIRNHVKGQGRLSDVGQRMPKPIDHS